MVKIDTAMINFIIVAGVTSMCTEDSFSSGNSTIVYTIYC